MCKWDKVFKNGPSKICGRQKKIEGVCFMQTIPLKFFKSCLPQILFGPFFNTLSQMHLKKHVKVPEIVCIIISKSGQKIRLRVVPESTLRVYSKE